MVRGFDHGLQFLRRVERDDAPRRDRDFLAGLGVAAGVLRLLAQLEIAEAGELHAVARLERRADFLEEALHHVLGFALVEAQLLEEQVGEFGLGEGHVHAWVRSTAAKRFSSRVTNPPTVASISASVKVRAVSCMSTRIARLFLPLGSPAPR